MLNFFDPECVPCVEEHPELLEFDEQESRLGNDGAELVTVVFRDDRDGVAEFFADEGGDWPVVYDDDGSIATAFGVTLVPETWLVDPNGVVRWRTISTVGGRPARRGRSTSSAVARRDGTRGRAQPRR